MDIAHLALFCASLPHAVWVSEDISSHLTITHWAFTLGKSDPGLKSGDMGVFRTRSSHSGSSSFLWKTHLGTKKLKSVLYGTLGAHPRHPAGSDYLYLQGGKAGSKGTFLPEKERPVGVY